jgi:hypothetical protein
MHGRPPYVAMHESMPMLAVCMQRCRSCDACCCVIVFVALMTAYESQCNIEGKTGGKQALCMSGVTGNVASSLSADMSQ